MAVPPSSRSPDTVEVIRAAFDYMKQGLYTMLPGAIQSYDPTTQKATIKPLIKRALPTNDGGELLEALPVLTDVPVRFPRGGGAFMTFPVKQGDFGILEFCMYSLDAYIAGDGTDTDPGDFRTHDISDAIFHLGVGPDSKAIQNVDPDNVVVGFEGGVEIAINKDKMFLGSRTASDALALASKVDARCSAIESNLQTHVHPTALGPSGPETPLIATGTSTASTIVLAE